MNVIVVRDELTGTSLWSFYMQVLRHGFFEMKFINEIKFLKAYYYSILGKYAFTPADRMEWTEKAILDLHSLGIPYQRYVNSDPQHYYTDGKPADYTVLAPSSN
jgi:hypothetical protein